jgi:hypothetical protein
VAITRQNVADYLNDQFSALAGAIGQDPAALTGYKPDIDNALRKLGKTESELADAAIPDGDRALYFAWAEYFAARRIWRQLGKSVDHTMGETTIKYGDRRKQAKDIMDDAAAALAALGYDVTGTGWSVGSLNLDWLEPEVLA